MVSFSGGIAARAVSLEVDAAFVILSLAIPDDNEITVGVNGNAGMSLRATGGVIGAEVVAVEERSVELGATEENVGVIDC